MEGTGGRRNGLPAEPALPAFAAIESKGVDATLRALGLPGPFTGLRMLKHHPGRRCTFALRAAGRPLVAKAYRRSVADQVALFTELERHGLAGVDGPTAPRLVASDLDLRIVVLTRLDGAHGEVLIARGPRVGELAGDWLARQWAAPVDVGLPYGPAPFLARVERDCAPVVAASPRLGAAAVALLAALGEHPPPERDPALVHGSFSVNHVIDLGAGAGVVDWDGFVQGPPELDAATFLATLARAAGGSPALAVSGALAAAAFRDSVTAALDPDALAWYEAGARIRNARHLCVLRPAEWEARAERLLATAWERPTAARPPVLRPPAVPAPDAAR
jgi:phosphotransferase family enzyme